MSFFFQETYATRTNSIAMKGGETETTKRKRDVDKEETRHKSGERFTKNEESATLSSTSLKRRRRRGGLWVDVDAAEEEGEKCGTKGSDSSSSLVGSPDTICFSQDMPMTPSLTPMAPLEMPALNRLVSNDWPLLNRLRADRSQGVCIIRSDAGKSPTPKAMFERSTSFRNIADSLRAIPTLLRKTSEMSTSSSAMGSTNTGEYGYDVDAHELPRLFSLPSSPCKGGGTISKENSPIVRDGRRHGRRLNFRRLQQQTLTGSHEQEVSSPVDEFNGRSRRRADVSSRTLSADFNDKTMKVMRRSVFHPRALKLSSPKPPGRTRAKSMRSKRKRASTGQDHDAHAASTNKETQRAGSGGGVAEGGCSCKRSRCRKKYCLCFSLGRACRDTCKCEDCGNTPEDALFDGQFSRQGCRCTNSRCRKKYCICFANAFKCSPFCKCQNCENKPPGVDQVATDTQQRLLGHHVHSNMKAIVV